MPRSNHPRNRRRDQEPEPIDLERALRGLSRTESKRDGQWHVQSISASTSAKSYLCPGCALEIEPGAGHVVAWRADSILGDDDALASRRHWHQHCWRIQP